MENIQNLLFIYFFLGGGGGGGEISPPKGPEKTLDTKEANSVVQVNKMRT